MIPIKHALVIDDDETRYKNYCEKFEFERFSKHIKWEVHYVNEAHPKRVVKWLNTKPGTDDYPLVFDVAILDIDFGADHKMGGFEILSDLAKQSQNSSQIVHWNHLLVATRYKGWGGENEMKQNLLRHAKMHDIPDQHILSMNVVGNAIDVALAATRFYTDLVK